MPIFSLALKSLINRRMTAGLTVLAIAMSVALLLGVERLRTEAKASFANTVSGTDLIVGARSGGIQLLLYSVFRIGNATNNIAWSSVETLRARPEVAWAVPISLGDSHRGFRVMGTTADYFQYYRYGRKRPLTMADRAGFERVFDDVFDAVLGADVAAQLGYALGDEIVIAHGLGAHGFRKHDDKPFRVSGILAKTGTPVDRTVHVSLQGIEAIHIDWRNGTPIPGLARSADAVRQMDLQPQSVTAVLLGLESRFAIFGLQRWINEFRSEPLLAIIPGVALQELWDLMGTAEAALKTISIFVVMTGLLGMLTMLLAGLEERRREMAILRSVGARPVHIFGLLVMEAAWLATVGALLGLALLYALIALAAPILDTRFGLYLPWSLPTIWEWMLLLAVAIAGALAGMLPAIKAMRQSLADGMAVRN